MPRIDGGPFGAAVELAALLCRFAERTLVVHPLTDGAPADVYPPGQYPRLVIGPDR